MKMAKALADDNQACYSRKIGVVLMSEDHEPISWGYNGSIAKIPHNDDPRYLSHLWKNLLTEEQKEYLRSKYNLNPVMNLAGEPIKIFYNDRETCDPVGESFIHKFSNCQNCPRRLLDIPSGEGLDLCGCAHAERNAIANAAKRGISTKNAIAYCWCGVPCFDCTSMLLQSGIQKVYCLHVDGPDYSKSSRGLFKMRNVELIIVKKEDILIDRIVDMELIRECMI